MLTMFWNQFQTSYHPNIQHPNLSNLLCEQIQIQAHTHRYLQSEAYGVAVPQRVEFKRISQIITGGFQVLELTADTHTITVKFDLQKDRNKLVSVSCKSNDCFCIKWTIELCDCSRWKHKHVNRAGQGQMWRT